MSIKIHVGFLYESPSDNAIFGWKAQPYDCKAGGQASCLQPWHLGLLFAQLTNVQYKDNPLI